MTVPFVVVAGGDPIPEDALADVPPGATVIAADSGADRAAAIGLAIDLLVGDLDSISRSGLRAAAARGIAVESYPAEKDHTDLELAMLAAIERGASDVVVLGGHGGRVDHYLANAMLLAAPTFAAVNVMARFGPARVWVVRRRTTLAGRPGDLLTLLAVHGPARGVTTTGLQWTLTDEDLLPGSSRGVSNVLVDAAPTVAVHEGVVLAIAPGAAPA